jgi:hypothetical protein
MARSSPHSLPHFVPLSIYAAFQRSEIWFILHGVTGLLVVSVTILALVAFSFAARYPWGTIGLSALLFLQLVIQTLIAHLRCHSWSPASTR